jgi:hypothetical protein
VVPTQGGIEQESKRLWGSPGDLSIRRSGW